MQILDFTATVPLLKRGERQKLVGKTHTLAKQIILIFNDNNKSKKIKAIPLTGREGL
jgi:hypothetical protein